MRIATEADAIYSPIANDGTRFWMHTTSEAPNGRVVELDLARSGREDWKTILPESSNHLDSVSMIDDTLIANYLADAQSLVELHSRDGSLLEQLVLPAIGTAVGFSGKRTDTETFFQFTNFTTPAAIYGLDMKARRSTVYRQPRLKFNPDEYETTQIFYTSKDGTRVPMFLSYKKSLALDGANPTLLYGYGGFNISLRPEFSSANLLWMEMGGIYAQPSLRGGGEYGEAWHEAGTKLAKQNVFDDFIGRVRVADREPVHVTGEGLRSPAGLNGGLLVAVCEIQRPDLFGAALPP